MSANELVESRESTAAAKRGFELRRRPALLVGGVPTVSLLPRELRAAARGRSIRRAFVFGVVVAVVVAGGATAGASALAGASQARLAAANATTQELVGQLAKFRDVQLIQQDVALGTAAVEVASSTEIDWQGQIDSIEADMPTGWDVTSIQADSASPVVDYAQGASPLDQPRAATMQLSITTTDMTTIGPWLRKLRSIEAYADASASVISDDTTGYTIQLTLHLSPKALESAKKATK